MNQRRPPILATWLLEHLTDRYRRDALVGDLVEEYRCGRSYGWYWRQALSALFAAGLNAVRRRLPGLRALVIWWGAWAILGVLFKQPYFLFFALDASFVWMRAKALKRRAPVARTTA